MLEGYRDWRALGASTWRGSACSHVDPFSYGVVASNGGLDVWAKEWELSGIYFVQPDPKQKRNNPQVCMVTPVLMCREEPGGDGIRPTWGCVMPYCADVWQHRSTERLRIGVKWEFRRKKNTAISCVKTLWLCIRGTWHKYFSTHHHRFAICLYSIK